MGAIADYTQFSPKKKFAYTANFFSLVGKSAVNYLFQFVYLHTPAAVAFDESAVVVFPQILYAAVFFQLRSRFQIPYAQLYTAV